VLSLWHEARLWRDRRMRERVARVTGGAGQPFDVDEATIIASNGRIHDRMVAILNGRRPPAGRGR
jgi:hypothetical protein